MLTPEWELQDAAKTARQHPYTFYKPSAEAVGNLAIGDHVKLIFTGEPANPDEPRAERMWVLITSITEGLFNGCLLYTSPSPRDS